MNFKIEYMGQCGKWYSYISMPGSEQSAMRCAMSRKKAMGCPIRVLNNKGHVVAVFQAQVFLILGDFFYDQAQEKHTGIRPGVLSDF